MSNNFHREAKGLTQSLKESLKKHDAWEREIEFQRSNLRRQYLQLIFVHPYTKESKDADQALWMTTSYFIISAYKQRIAAADAVAHHSPDSNGHNRGGRHEQNGHHGKPSGIVEHRKLVHRFRQFLAEEEKFWTSLIVRIVRVFDLQDARSALGALGITMTDENASEASPGQGNRRNIFPSEDATEMPSQNQKEQKLIMLSKALVCLGDIARYREHYNEGGGRPRAGKDFHDDAKTVVRGRGGRRGGAEQPPRPRNYSRAQECYERARILVPDVGNACHQLAILASYQQDPFAGVLQYYRAMCVKHPYETAASNLDSTLSRSLEAYKNLLAKIEIGATELSQSPKLRVERFKKSLVALHGLWKLEPAAAEKQLPGHAEMVMATFSALVSERVLPTDIIWKTLVIALGALWRFRVLRDPNAKRDPKRSVEVEARILEHILSILRILLQIGTVQLADASNSPEPAVSGIPLGFGEVQPDLAQNITAIFRRTLPALRIGSKWLTVHFSYIIEAPSRLNSDIGMDADTLLSEFWLMYDGFKSLLENIFPYERLPKMTLPLEEDVEISGFAPLKRAMFDPNPSTANGLEPGQNQVHPNEEQLMRIADLLADADKLVKLRPEPDQSNVVASLNSSPEVVVNAMVPLALVEQETEPQNMDLRLDDDDDVTVSTRTDDDPIQRAMAAVLDDEEEVVYPLVPRSLVSNNDPVIPRSLASTNDPVVPRSLTSMNDPMLPRTLAPGHDSVHSRILVPPSGSPLPAAAPLLFGYGSPSAPASIWSTTTQDSAAFSASNLRSNGYSGAQSRVSPPANVQTYPIGLGLTHNGSYTPTTPTRPSGFSHQRQLSQVMYPTGSSPIQQGSWVGQGSSQLSMTSQASSQPRHTMSPGLMQQQTLMHTRSSLGPQLPSPPYSQLQQQAQLFPGSLSASQSSTFPGLPVGQSHMPRDGLSSQNTWSYSGADSLSGMGASLGPFAPAQSRQPQTQRSSGWAPT
ncbi:hypothetical protein BU17DRAFT_53078 [Hysterangium stoloniferum]|nr:hypothetical protein BU17DRAFT_53078 [Hysterangium stoloniferum]